MVHTLTGGVKATILTDYIHTIIIYAMILTCLFVVYSRSHLIGNPDTMYELFPTHQALFKHQFELILLFIICFSFVFRSLTYTSMYHTRIGEVGSRVYLLIRYSEQGLYIIILCTLSLIRQLSTCHKLR